jgi:hypothetical protein
MKATKRPSEERSEKRIDCDAPGEREWERERGLWESESEDEEKKNARRL